MHFIRRIAAVAATLLAGAALASDPEPFKLVSIDEAAAMHGKPGVVFLDANPPDVYAKGHVPGAVQVGKPLDGAKLPQDKATRLVAYCKNPR